MGMPFGAAYVFERQETQWVHKTKLVSPNTDIFSGDVALSGTHLMLSAHTTPSRSIVYFFERQTDGSWGAPQTFITGNAGSCSTNDIAVGSCAAGAVAISGDVAAATGL